MISEFTYIKEPQLDQMVGLIWQLAQELQVTKARLTAMEQCLVTAGVLAPGAVEAHHPDASQQEDLGTERDGFVDRLLRVLTETDDHNAPMREQFPALKRA